MYFCSLVPFYIVTQLDTLVDILHNLTFYHSICCCVAHFLKLIFNTTCFAALLICSKISPLLTLLEIKTISSAKCRLFRQDPSIRVIFFFHDSSLKSSSNARIILVILDLPDRLSVVFYFYLIVVRRHFNIKWDVMSNICSYVSDLESILARSIAQKIFKC